MRGLVRQVCDKLGFWLFLASWLAACQAVYGSELDLDGLVRVSFRSPIEDTRIKDDFFRVDRTRSDQRALRVFDDNPAFVMEYVLYARDEEASAANACSKVNIGDRVNVFLLPIESMDGLVPRSGGDVDFSALYSSLERKSVDGGLDVVSVRRISALPRKRRQFVECAGLEVKLHLSPNVEPGSYVLVSLKELDELKNYILPKEVQRGMIVRRILVWGPPRNKREAIYKLYRDSMRYYEHGDLIAAIDLVEEILKLNPLSIRGNLLAARIHLGLGRLLEAEAHLASARQAHERGLDLFDDAGLANPRFAAKMDRSIAAIQSSIESIREE